MKKSGRVVVTGLALAAVLGVGSVATNTGKEEKPTDKKIFDQSMLRRAWLLGACTEQTDTSMCELTWDRRGYCICLTREEPMLDNEVEKANINAGSKWKFRVCGPLPGQEGRTIVVIQNPEDGIPSGYQCTLLDPGILDNTSISSLNNTLEEVLERECGWPVSGGSWGCCPQCVLFDDGCPPCMTLCSYWDAWPGHEGECETP